MRAVGYFREASAGPRSSIGQQNRRFLDYCEAQGFEVAATYSEDGKQTTNAFDQLLHYLKQPEKGFILVIAPSPSTFAEDNVVAAARCLQVEHLGARVQFMDDSVNGDALQAILANFSSGKEDGMREKVKTALRKKAVRGEVLGRPPYGYKVGPRNRLEVIDDEAVVVRYIFRLYLQDNLGIRLIARRLNEEGLRTRRNAPWSMVSIRDILRNRAYLGTYQRLGVRVPGTHAALVSPDDFRHVQERLIERRTNYSPRNVSGFLLSGILVCGYCGNRLIGVSRKQSWTRRRDGSEQMASYRYYQCGSRTNQGICSYHTHRTEELEEQVRQQLADLDPKQLATAGDDTQVISEWQAEAKRSKERLSQVDRRLRRYLEQAATAGVVNDHLKAQGLELAEERLKVEEELRDSEWRSEHYASAAERRRTRNAALDLLVSEWETLSMPERQQLLKELVENVRVTDEKVSLTLRP